MLLFLRVKKKYFVVLAVAMFLPVFVQAADESDARTENKEAQSLEKEQQPKVERSLDKKPVKIPQVTEDGRLKERPKKKKNGKDPVSGGKKAAIAGAAIVSAFLVALLCDSFLTDGDVRWWMYDKLYDFLDLKPQRYKWQLLHNESTGERREDCVRTGQHKRIPSLDVSLRAHAAFVGRGNELRSLLWRTRYEGTEKDRQFLDKFVAQWDINQYNQQVRLALEKFSRGARGLQECFEEAWGCKIGFYR